MNACEKARDWSKGQLGWTTNELPAETAHGHDAQPGLAHVGLLKCRSALSSLKIESSWGAASDVSSGTESAALTDPVRVSCYTLGKRGHHHVEVVGQHPPVKCTINHDLAMLVPKRGQHCERAVQVQCLHLWAC